MNGHSNTKALLHRCTVFPLAHGSFAWPYFVSRNLWSPLTVHRHLWCALPPCLQPAPHWLTFQSPKGQRGLDLGGGRCGTTRTCGELSRQKSGPPKMPKSLEIGDFGNKTGSKLGQKRGFSKTILDLCDRAGSALDRMARSTYRGTDGQTTEQPGHCCDAHRVSSRIHIIAVFSGLRTVYHAHIVPWYSGGGHRDECVSQWLAAPTSKRVQPIPIPMHNPPPLCTVTQGGGGSTCPKIHSAEDNEEK